MEASGSPSISDGAVLSEYRELVYVGDRYNDNTLSFAYLEVLCNLKIYMKVYLMHKTNHA